MARVSFDFVHVMIWKKKTFFRFVVFCLIVCLFDCLWDDWFSFLCVLWAHVITQQHHISKVMWAPCLSPARSYVQEENPMDKWGGESSPNCLFFGCGLHIRGIIADKACERYCRPSPTIGLLSFDFWFATSSSPTLPWEYVRVRSTWKAPIIPVGRWGSKQKRRSKQLLEK